MCASKFPISGYKLQVSSPHTSKDNKKNATPWHSLFQHNSFETYSHRNGHQPRGHDLDHRPGIIAGHVHLEASFVSNYAHLALLEAYIFDSSKFQVNSGICSGNRSHPQTLSSIPVTIVYRLYPRKWSALTHVKAKCTPIVSPRAP